MEKNITYQTLNSYSVLNTLTTNTTRIWFAFHGLGYLSKYFIQQFKHLASESNYIVAPQAPSVYYKDKHYKRVGANWYTRENVNLAKEGNNRYISAVFNKEIREPAIDRSQLIFVGFSQGVSALLRWMAHSKTICDCLVIHSGGIPEELTPTDFQFLPNETVVYLICGKQDEYLTKDRLNSEIKKGKALFGDKLNTRLFDGTHTFNLPFVNSLVQ